MSQLKNLSGVRLDPWTASSLLQKAIRRDEREIATTAAAMLHRQRGPAIWRRLVSIALEDIGIADMQLVWDVARLGTDKQLRSVLGSDRDLINDLCLRMAAAPKDRSADYVFCAATKLETALDDRRRIDALPLEEKLAIAKGDFEPLPRRAIAALSACTVRKNERVIISEEGAAQFIANLRPLPRNLENVIMTLTGRHSHVFALMIMLVWSQLEFTGGASGYSEPPLPPAEHLNGVPLWAFDKHTAVGKKAISRLPEHSARVRTALSMWVDEERWADAALMATFYADAAPVARRLDWFGSHLLEYIGFNADMAAAGCAMEGTNEVLQAVRHELPVVNFLRRAAAPDLQHVPPR